MGVPALRPTAIAVYVYRRGAARGGGADSYELLQIRRSPTARGHNGLWQTVYGGIEPDPDGRDGQETAIAAARRELSEETGLTPLRMFQVEYVETFYFRPTDAMLLMPVFAVEVDRTAEVVLNHEHDAFRWVPEAEIAKAFMWRTQREALAIMLHQLRHPGDAQPLLEI